MRESPQSGNAVRGIFSRARRSRARRSLARRLRSRKDLRQVCVVVGMHNSGTSLVANLLNAAGVPLGEHLLLREQCPEAERPRYDYYEDAEVVALQEQTLLNLQRHWSSYRAGFPLPGAEHPARQRFRTELHALLKQRLQKRRLWLVKDPRTAVLLDDWMAVLEQLGLQIKLLVMHRDPISNCRSFHSKGQVPLLWAEALWQRTYAQVLQSAATLPAEQVCFCRFETLQANPAAETERLCRFLNWTPSVAQRNQVMRCYDPRLPTERAQGQGASDRGHPWSQALHQQLCEGQPALPAATATSSLAQEIEHAITEIQPPLELNGHRQDGQSLQPKLRITIVTAELQGWGPAGGIGSAYYELARALADAGHPLRILLVRSDAISGELPAGVTVDRLDTSGLNRLQLQQHVLAALRQDPCDVLHLHDWLGLASGLREAYGREGPQIIVGLHGPSAWVRQGNPWPRDAEGGLQAPLHELMAEGLTLALEQDGLEQADLLVSPSAYLADWVQRQFVTINKV